MWEWDCCYQELGFGDYHLSKGEQKYNKNYYMQFFLLFFYGTCKFITSFTREMSYRKQNIDIGKEYTWHH